MPKLELWLTCSERPHYAALLSVYLGYSDPSNFLRAFRRWTGVAATAFRLARGAGRGAAPAAFL